MRVRSLASLSGRCHELLSVGHRQSSNLAFLWLWLWCRLAAAALIQPLDWELICAVGVGLKRQKQNKQKNPQKIKQKNSKRQKLKSLLGAQYFFLCIQEAIQTSLMSLSHWMAMTCAGRSPHQSEAFSEAGTTSYSSYIPRTMPGTLKLHSGSLWNELTILIEGWKILVPIPVLWLSRLKCIC